MLKSYKKYMTHDNRGREVIPEWIVDKTIEKKDQQIQQLQEKSEMLDSLARKRLATIQQLQEENKRLQKIVDNDNEYFNKTARRDDG